MSRINLYIAALLLLLSACGSSPPVRYYGLNAIESIAVDDPDGSPVIAMGPFRMPEYLNRSQMVTYGANSELLVDDLSRWAEPLDGAVHRILASNVDILLTSAVVVAYPAAALLDVDYRLVGRIARFNADQSGLVVLEMQWAAGDSDGNQLLAPRRKRYDSQATDASSPGSIARAMSEALEKASRDIAKEIESTIR